MTIERERSAALPSPKDALEQHLLRDLRAVRLPEPVRELHFMWCCEHPKSMHGTHACNGPSCLITFAHVYNHPRNWRFDLAWPEQMLACEVDGGTFSGGRHTRGTGYENDCEKLAEAVLRGWKVLRFTKGMIEDGRALEFLERAFGRGGTKT